MIYDTDNIIIKRACPRCGNHLEWDSHELKKWIYNIALICGGCAHRIKVECEIKITSIKAG